MIEVRSALTAQLLGYAPGRLHWPSRVGSHWKMDLVGKYGDAMIHQISLPVLEFVSPGRFINRWAVLNSDGHPIETLRKIVGWRDVDQETPPAVT